VKLIKPSYFYSVWMKQMFNKEYFPLWFLTWRAVAEEVWNYFALLTELANIVSEPTNAM
jgi:hypothetical protein